MFQERGGNIVIFDKENQANGKIFTVIECDKDGVLVDPNLPGTRTQVDLSTLVQ